MRFAAKQSYEDICPLIPQAIEHLRFLSVHGLVDPESIWESLVVLQQHNPEDRLSLEHLLQYCDLSLLPTHPHLARYVDPIQTWEVPPFWLRGADIGSTPRRDGMKQYYAGSYLMAEGPGAIAVFYVFHRPAYGSYALCARAYVVRTSDARIFYMPPKADGSPRAYRQDLPGYLVPDVRDMLRRAGVR